MTESPTATLTHHLAHEEADGLPLIQVLLTAADWADFAAHIRRRQGIKGAAVYIPWILDDTRPPEQQRFLAALPAPARLINRLFWARNYQQRHLWRP